MRSSRVSPTPSIPRLRRTSGSTRVEDAKQGVPRGAAADRKQADTLIDAMKTWIEQRKANPAGVDPAVVSGLESWIKERSAIAQQTAAMGLSHGARWG